MTSRCTGHCCKHFALVHSPEELWELYREWKHNGSTPMEMEAKNKWDPTIRSSSGLRMARSGLSRDIHIIAPMARYIGFVAPPDGMLVNPSDDELLGVPRKKRGKAHYYYCVHFDEAKKVCSIYDERPDMCKSYPNGHKCEFAQCTWKGMREKKQSKAQLEARKKKLLDREKELKNLGGDLVKLKRMAHEVCSD